MTRLEKEIWMFFGMVILFIIVAVVLSHFFNVDVKEETARMLIGYVVFRVGLNIGYQKGERQYINGMYDGILNSIYNMNEFLSKIGKKDLLDQFFEYVKEKYDVKIGKEDGDETLL